MIVIYDFLFQNANVGDGERETLHSLARKGYTAELRALLLQNEGTKITTLDTKRFNTVTLLAERFL